MRMMEQKKTIIYGR